MLLACSILQPDDLACSALERLALWRKVERARFWTIFEAARLRHA